MRRSIFAALALLAAQPCGADEPPPLEPVVVTATRRETLDTQTPLSVSAMGTSQLSRGDIASLKDLSATVPNIGYIEFTARAISNPQFRGVGGSTTNPGVTTYIDGVPQLNADTSNQELVDIGQVEFVRGAQGTLYGRNTLGGVVNISSRLPTQDWALGLTSGAGGDAENLQKLRIAGPLPLADSAFALSGGYRSRDGYSENLQSGQRLDSRRASFGKAQGAFGAGPLQVRAIAGLENARDGDFALYDLGLLRATPFQVRHDFQGYTHRTLQSQTLLADWYGDAVRVRSITGRVAYRAREQTDLDASEDPNLTRDNARNGEQFTQELQLFSADGAPWRPLASWPALSVNWVGGLSGFGQRNHQNTINYISQRGLLAYGTRPPPNPTTGNNPNAPARPPSQNDFAIPFVEIERAEDRGIAALRDSGEGVYGQLEAALDSGWRLAAGLRYDREHKRADLYSVTMLIGTDGTETPQNGPTTVDGARNFTALTPALRVSYVADDWMAYASAARGYRAGGFNPIAPAGAQAYEEEHSLNYEAGAKATLWGDALRANLAVFRILLDDLQLNTPVAGGAGRFYIRNAGDAVNQGVELDLRSAPYGGVEAYGTLGFLSAHFGAGSLNFSQDVGGHRLPFTDPRTMSLGAIASLGAFRLQPEVQQFGAYYYTPDNDERLSRVTLLNLRGSWHYRDFRVELWGRNLTDVAYVPLAIPFTGIAPSGFVGEDTAGRTFGVALHYDLSQ